MEGEAGKRESFVWKWLNWDCLNSLLELSSFLFTWKKSSDQLYALTTCSYFSNSLKIEVGFLAYNCSWGIKDTFYFYSRWEQKEQVWFPYLSFSIEEKKVKIFYPALCRCPVQAPSNISALLNPWDEAYVLWKPCTRVRCVFCDMVQGGFFHTYAVAHGTTGWQWLHLSLTLSTLFPVTVILGRKNCSTEDLVFFQQSYWELFHSCLPEQD